MFREKDYKRSPLKKKPLRQAGQSLDEEINRLFDEKVDYHIVIIVVFAVVTLFEWYRWFLKVPINPIIFSIFPIIIFAFSIRKILIYKKNIKRLQMARDGERIVGESLELLRAKGYLVFHDIIGGNFNIDHVIVGQNGVFTVETKTVSKPNKGQAEIHYDGEGIIINGFSPDRDPIIQAKAQANWLKDLLKDFTGRSVHVQPVILYPCWFVSRQPKGSELWVLNEKAFPAFLDNERSLLNSEEVHAIAAHLSRYARNI